MSDKPSLMLRELAKGLKTVNEMANITISEMAAASSVSEREMAIVLQRLKARSRETDKTVRELVGDIVSLVEGGENTRTSIAKVCGDGEEET